MTATKTTVPAHKHDTFHCERCEQHRAAERALLMAASLCYLTNVVGDQHRKLTGDGNGYAHDLAKMAWEALGKPNREQTNKICASADGWDGVENHGFDWFRDEKSEGDRINDIVDLLLANDDGPVTPFVVLSRAAALKGHKPDDVANAMHQALADVGVRNLDSDGIPSGEF